MTIKKKERGFTLVEMMVSVGIFAVVVMAIVGALLSLVDSNRKAQALKSVMNNLNFALENMGRNLRVGYDFHCEEDIAPTNPTVPQSCPSGGVLIAFESQYGDTSDPDDQFIYRFNNGRIEKSDDSGATFIAITSEEVNITDAKFFVTGTTIRDQYQPRVVMTIRGSAGVDKRVETSFSIQSTVSQRLLDL